MKRRVKGFTVKPLYRFKKPKLFTVAREKLSFTVAAFTVAAFVMGNMVGQHGWYAFWKTVLGQEDDALIVFDGMVTPVEYIPDYRRWSEYGGNTEDHTYAEIPKDLLVPLPAYRRSELRNHDALPYEHRSLAQLAYSMGHMSSYDTGEDHSGSHAGVDIRVPIGTPIRSVANGVVEKVQEQNYGYGYYVVVRYPNVPDVTSDTGVTTYHGTFAHLSSILVREGQIVRRGETIAYSGDTGLASGPHLHYQMDTDEAPWHPYWPFTAQEASEAGYTFYQAVNAGLNQHKGSLYSASPVTLVQEFTDYAPTLATNGNAALNGVVAEATISSSAPAVEIEPALTPVQRLLQRAAKRAESRQSLADAREARRQARIAAAKERATFAPAPPAVTTTSVVATTARSTFVPAPAVETPDEVHRIEITHSGKVELGWQTITLRAVDREGRLVRNPKFEGKVYVRSEFGDADIREDTLEAYDFRGGEAYVNVQVRGQKTVLFVTRGVFETVSAPMVYQR